MGLQEAADPHVLPGLLHRRTAGSGGSVASIITYNEARRWDRNPDRWGTGVIEGVAVPEAANNACVGGSLVPLMALGIPGSASAAILMGGLLSQGLTPGRSFWKTMRMWRTRSFPA